MPFFSRLKFVLFALVASLVTLAGCGAPASTPGTYEAFKGPARPTPPPSSGQKSLSKDELAIQDAKARSERSQAAGNKPVGKVAP